jgi:hypothetical protein
MQKTTQAPLEMTGATFEPEVLSSSPPVLVAWAAGWSAFSTA